MIHKLTIYQKNTKQTYLYFILENLKLIKELELQKNYDDAQGFLEDKWLYVGRAKHFQLMSLIGITAEHLIKLILLKRGYVLNNVKEATKKYSDKFMNELNEYNKNTPSQDSLDKLYDTANNEIKIDFSDKLIMFNECLTLFEKDNEANYFSDVKTLTFNHNYKYLNEFDELNGTNCLKIIQRMRNNYIHKADGMSEFNGILWYMHNFLLWLAKKEYPVFFKDEKYIDYDNKEKLFEDCS